MKHLKYLFLFIGLALFASCSDSDVDGLVGDGKTVSFTGFVGDFRTRVTNNSWDAGDAIGIFALKADQGLSDAGIFDGKNNVKYVSDSKGKFTPAGAPINFPENGNLDFIAYYPFKNELANFVYNIDISNQSNPAAIDLIYSNNAKGESGSNPFVDLGFKHMLSKLVFNVSLEEGLSFDNGFNVVIKDVVVDGGFDLANGESTLGTTKKQISTIVNIASDKKTANVSSIVVPGQNLENVTIVFSLGGKDYEWKPYSQGLNPSTRYIYSLKLVIDESGLPTVEELQVGATIEDWIEDVIGGEIVLAPTGDSEEPVEGEYKTIQDIRTMYTNSGEEKLVITEAVQLKAVIISDRVGGNSTSLKNGYLQDEAGNGLGFRATADHEFNMGEELIIDLEGAEISKYGEALQLGFDPAKATVNETGVVIAPKELTVEQVLDGMYDGVLVKVNDVQFKEYEGHTYFEGTFSAHNHAIENENGKTIDVRTAKFATFKDDALPKGSGNIVGIMTVFNGDWQVYPRNTNDLSGMSNDVSTRFDSGGTDPGEPGEPGVGGNLLFPGSDFNNWATFTSSLNQYGVTFGKESATGGREGSGAMHFEGQIDKNSYVFTVKVPEGFSATGKTKINFWVKGTAAKSLSMNVYIDTGGQMGVDYKCYNMDEHVPYTTHKVLGPTDANSYAKGGIDTSGEWIQVTLDISSLVSSINSTPGEDLFALKVGSKSEYNLFLDDITIE